MAERELAIILRARDLASKNVRGLKKELGTLGAAGTRALNGLSTAIKRVGAAAAIGLVGAIAAGTRSLGELERITNLTNATIESTGGAAGQTAQAIRDHAQALEQLTTADDKAIQEGQNMLLTFTKIGGKTFPAATEAVTNMAIAMAKGDVANADFAGTAKQVGKALNDPVKGITALSKAGVSFTQQQKDQIKALVAAGKVEEAQAVILKELTVEFGKAGEAAGTGFEADMRRVQDAGEDASQALARGVMPALTRVTNWLSKKLADPAVLKAIDELGRGLGDAAMAALDFIETVDFKAIGAGLKTAKDAAGGIVSAFMAMPDWVKTAIITGWGLNKLTGGAVGGIVGELGKGLIKGVLGMNAGVVNINAGMVNGGGGLPGGGAAAGAGAGGLTAGGIAAGAGALVITAASAAVIGTAIAGAIYGEENQSFKDKGLNAAEVAAIRYYSADAAEQATIAKRIGGIPTRADYTSAQAKLTTTTNALGVTFGRDSERVRQATLETKRETTRGLAITAGAIRAKDLSVKVNTQFISNVSVSVTASSIKAKQTYSQRAGKANGSYGGNYDPRL